MNRALSSSRRRLLQGAGALVSLSAAAAHATAVQPADPFEAKSFADALAAVGGLSSPSTSVVLEVPAIAEDGALVPVVVTSSLAGAREVLVLVDPSPQPLALRVLVPAGTEAFVAARIRMAGSGTVIAAVRTDDGRLYTTARPVQVTVGGCG